MPAAPSKPLSERLAEAVAKAEHEVKVEQDQERRRLQRLQQQQQLQLRRPSPRPEGGGGSPRSSRSRISSGSPSPKRSSSAAASVRVSRPLPGLAEKLVGRSDHFAEFATILASEVQRLLRYTLLGYAGLPPDIEKQAQGDIDQGLSEIVEHLAVYVENAVEAVDSIHAEIKDAATAWKTREGIPVVKLKDVHSPDFSMEEVANSDPQHEQEDQLGTAGHDESQPGDSSESLESAQSVGTLVKKTSTVALTGQLDASVAQIQDLEKTMGQKDTKVQNLQNLLRTLRFQYYSDLENQKNRFRKVMMDLLPDLSPESLQEAMNSVSAVKMFNLSDFYDEDIKQAVDRKATELQADFAIERDALLSSIRTLSESESSLRKQLEKEKQRADELEAELECSEASGDDMEGDEAEASRDTSKVESEKAMAEEPSEGKAKIRRKKSRDQIVSQETTLNHSTSIIRDRAEFSRLMTENEVAGKRIQELAMHAAAMRDLASKYEIRVKSSLPQTEEHVAFVAMAQQVQGRAEKMTATVTSGEHALDEESKKAVLSKAEVEVLRQDLTDHKREVDVLRGQKEQLDADAAELRVQLETLTASRQELQELCKAHDAEVHSLKEQVEKLRAVEAAKVENMRHARTTMKILNMVKKAKTEEDRDTASSEALASPSSLAPPSPRPGNTGASPRSASKGSDRGQSPNGSAKGEEGEEKVSAGDVDRLVSQLVADTVEKEKAWVREHMQREIDQIKMELWQVKEENFAILSERRQLRESVSRMSRLSRQSSLQTLGQLEPLTPTGASANPSPQASLGTGSFMANFPTSPAGNPVGQSKSMPSSFHNVPGILNLDSPKKKRAVTYEDDNMGPRGSKLHILVPDQEGNVVNMAGNQQRGSDSSDSTDKQQPFGEAKSEGRRDSTGSGDSEEWVQAAVTEELEAIPEIEMESVAVQCGDIQGRSRVGPHDLNLVCRLGPPGYTEETTRREVSEFSTTEAQTESIAEVSLRLGVTVAEGCQTEAPQPRGITVGAQTEEQHIPLNLPSQGPEALRRRLSSMKSTASGGMTATATGGKRSSMKKGSMERTASSKDRGLTAALTSGLATPPPPAVTDPRAKDAAASEAGKSSPAAGAAAGPNQTLKALNPPASPALSSLSGDLGGQSDVDVDLGDADGSEGSEAEATVFSEEDVARMMKLVQLECENEMRGQLLNQREKLVKAWPRAMSEGAISRRISSEREKDKQLRRQQETGRRRLNLSRDKPLEAEMVLFREEVEEERQKALQGIDNARLLLYTNESSLDARVDDMRNHLQSEDFVSRWQALGAVQKTTQAFKRDFDKFKERIKAVHFEADRLRAHLGMTRDELLKKACDSAMLFRLQANWLRKCSRMLEKFGVSTGVPSVLMRKSCDENTLEVAMREQLAEDSLHTAETAQAAFEERLERFKSVTWHRVYPDFRQMSLAHQREAFRIADSLVEFHLSLNKITRSIPDDDLEEVRIAIRTDPRAGMEPYMSKMIKDLVEKGMDVAIGHSTPQQIEAAMSVLCRVDLREQEIHRNYSESLGALDFCSIVGKSNARFRRPFDELVSHGRRACDKFDMYEEPLNPEMGETATTVHDDKLDFEFSDGEGDTPASPAVASGFSSEDPNHAINITTSASRMRQRIWKSMADTQSPSHWARSLTSMVSEATEHDPRRRAGGSGDSQPDVDSDTDQASDNADSTHGQHVSWRRQTRHSMQRKSITSSSSRGSEICDLGGASPRGGGYETVDEDSAEERDHSSASAASASQESPRGEATAGGRSSEGRSRRGRRKLSRSQSHGPRQPEASSTSPRPGGEGGSSSSRKETKSAGTMTEEDPVPVPLPTEAAINAASAAAIKHLGEQQLDQVQQMQDFLQWQQELPAHERMPEADFKQMVGAVMNDLREQEQQQMQCLEGLDLDLPTAKSEKGQQVKALMSHLEQERQRQATLQSQLEKQHAEQQARAQILENQRQALQQQIQDFKQKQSELEENSAEWRFQQQFDARQLHQQAQQLQMQQRQRQQKDQQQQQFQQQLLQEKDEQQQKLLQQQQQMQEQEQFLKEQLQKHQQQQLLEKDHHQQMLQEQEQLLQEKEELLKRQSQLQKQHSMERDEEQKLLHQEQEELLRRQHQELQEKEKLLHQQAEDRRRQQDQYQLLQQQQQQLQELQQKLQQQQLQQEQKQQRNAEGPAPGSSAGRLSIPIPELSSVELTKPAPAPISSLKSLSSTLFQDDDSDEEALSAEELAEKTRLEEQQKHLQRGLQELQDQQKQLQQQREQLQQQREALQQQEAQQQALQEQALQRQSSPRSQAGQSFEKPNSAAASLRSVGPTSPTGSAGPMSMSSALAAGGASDPAANGTAEAALDPEAAAKLAAEALAEQERLATAMREFEQQHQALRDQERRLLETEKRMQRDWHEQQGELHKLMKEAEKQHARLQAAKADAPKKEKKHRSSSKHKRASSNDGGDADGFVADSSAASASDPYPGPAAASPTTTSTNAAAGTSPTVAVTATGTSAVLSPSGSQAPARSTIFEPPGLLPGGQGRQSPSHSLTPRRRSSVSFNLPPEEQDRLAQAPGSNQDASGRQSTVAPTLRQAVLLMKAGSLMENASGESEASKPRFAAYLEKMAQNASLKGLLSRKSGGQTAGDGGHRSSGGQEGSEKSRESNTQGTGGMNPLAYLMLQRKLKAGVTVEVACQTEDSLPPRSGARNTATLAEEAANAAVARMLKRAEEEEDFEDEVIIPRWDDSDSAHGSKDSSKGGQKTIGGPSAAAARLARVRSRVNTMSRLLKRGQSDRNLTESAEVNAVGQQCDLAWEDVPHRVIQWLRTNLYLLLLKGNRQLALEREGDDLFPMMSRQKCEMYVWEFEKFLDETFMRKQSGSKDSITRASAGGPSLYRRNEQETQTAPIDDPFWASPAARRQSMVAERAKQAPPLIHQMMGEPGSDDEDFDKPPRPLGSARRSRPGSAPARPGYEIPLWERRSADVEELAAALGANGSPRPLLPPHYPGEVWHGRAALAPVRLPPDGNLKERLAQLAQSTSAEQLPTLSGKQSAKTANASVSTADDDAAEGEAAVEAKDEEPLVATEEDKRPEPSAGSSSSPPPERVLVDESSAEVEDTKTSGRQKKQASLSEPSDKAVKPPKRVHESNTQASLDLQPLTSSKSMPMGTSKSAKAPLKPLTATSSTPRAQTQQPGQQSGSSGAAPAALRPYARPPPQAPLSARKLVSEQASDYIGCIAWKYDAANPMPPLPPTASPRGGPAGGAETGAADAETRRAWAAWIKSATGSPAAGAALNIDFITTGHSAPKDPVKLPALPPNSSRGLPTSKSTPR